MNEETVVELICGICEKPFTEIVPVAALREGPERDRCVAIQLPACFACEAVVDPLES